MNIILESITFDDLDEILFSDPDGGYIDNAEINMDAALGMKIDG